MPAVPVVRVEAGRSVYMCYKISGRELGAYPRDESICKRLILDAMRTHASQYDSEIVYDGLHGVEYTNFWVVVSMTKKEVRQ